MLKEETIKVQKQLAWYCRDGETVEIEGARTERLHHYRRLVYNVVYGIIEQAFPVTNEKLTTPEFKGMVSDFFTKHDPQTPQVWKLPGEFYAFVSSQESELHTKYPFLNDLMLMEWTEILIYNQLEQDHDEFSKGKVNKEAPVVLNPDFELLKLSYPVFKKEVEDMKKGGYKLLMFRDQNEKKVHFIEVSDIHVIIISGLNEGMSFHDISQKVLDSLNIPNAEEAMKKLETWFDQLCEKGFVLGNLAMN